MNVHQLGLTAEQRRLVMSGEVWIEHAGEWIAVDGAGIVGTGKTPRMAMNELEIERLKEAFKQPSYQPPHESGEQYA